MRFVSALPAEEPARSLLQGMRREIAELYDDLDLDGPDMPKAGPAEFALPHGDFLVGDEAGEAICCGGLKRLPDGACPWVFPLLADDPEALFARLKAAGVPLTRLPSAGCCLASAAWRWRA